MTSHLEDTTHKLRHKNTNINIQSPRVYIPRTSTESPILGHTSEQLQKPMLEQILNKKAKHYEILKGGIPGQIPHDNRVACETKDFIASGINTKFYTSSFKSGNQEWFCVFDYCYTHKSGETTYIVQMRERAEL